VRLLFYGTIKNEWELFEKCVRSIQKNFFFFDWHVVVVDDGSNQDESEKASALAKKIGKLTVLKNEKNKGIISSLNKCIGYIKSTTSKDLICIPISADSLFINKAYPYLLFWAFKFRKAEFFFGKTVHKTENNKITGITGWSTKKGIQCQKSAKSSFLSGKCRPSGWAVAFRANVLTQYTYPNVGSLSDYFLNNLMTLKYRSYHSKQKIVETLERKQSFSSTFSEKENMNNLLGCVALFRAEGVTLSNAEVEQLLKSEKISYK